MAISYDFPTLLGFWYLKNILLMVIIILLLWKNKLKCEYKYVKKEKKSFQEKILAANRGENMISWSGSGSVLKKKWI